MNPNPMYYLVILLLLALADSRTLAVYDREPIAVIDTAQHAQMEMLFSENGVAHVSMLDRSSNTWEQPTPIHGMQTSNYSPAASAQPSLSQYGIQSNTFPDPSGQGGAMIWNSPLSDDPPQWNAQANADPQSQIPHDEGVQQWPRENDQNEDDPDDSKQKKGDKNGVAVSPTSLSTLVLLLTVVLWC